MRSFHPVAEARARLVCFPHAGGSASAYFTLSAALADVGIEVWAVQYPGRQDRFREACVEKADLIVDAVITELNELLGDGSAFGLFGHSMGALLAFETARCLEQDGHTPALLVVSGHDAPSLPWPPPGARSLANADNAALIDEMHLIAGPGTAPPFEPMLLRMILPPLRTDYRVLEGWRYVPGTRMNSPILALAGDCDPRVDDDAVAARWADEARAGFTMEILPGGHFFLDEHVPYLAKVIGARF